MSSRFCDLTREENHGSNRTGHPALGRPDRLRLGPGPAVAAQYPWKGRGGGAPGLPAGTPAPTVPLAKCPDPQVTGAGYGTGELERGANLSPFGAPIPQATPGAERRGGECGRPGW